jgi:formylglycine-generating enzyme required for sulfatase activity
MSQLARQILIIVSIPLCSVYQSAAQNQVPFRLPDTGQSGSYTSTSGEDSDIIINPPSYADGGDGTITDTITGLMWQKTDGGEMTFENAAAFCDSLALGGYDNWRLPSCLELFSINSYDNLNPALDLTRFTKTTAEYWWTNELRADDASKVWVVNAGGGIGAHPKAETKSAGGTKLFHVRAVRDPNSLATPASHFTDNGNGTITDNNTGLIWQTMQSMVVMTWEEALVSSQNIALADKRDWRLPNIKELQSLNDASLFKPSIDKATFANMLSGNYWSSTTLKSSASKAWDLNTEYGIVSYNDKTLKQHVLLVRGGEISSNSSILEAQIPGGEFEMGDHFGFIDPSHPSDEIPLHAVKVSSIYMAKTETTNLEYLAFLNSSLLTGGIEVRNNIVYKAGSNDIYCYTNQYASYYSIGYDGKVFSITDFRANHPVVGVMWCGAAAFCNWLSLQYKLQECYNLFTWNCDLTQNGYRLPTEAEWEYAARGGQLNPYFIYPTGNAVDIHKANLPDSGDPYETGAYPNTTPAGFYDGKLKQKSEFNWPGAAATYQTADGANGFGLLDMQGNVWEFVGDWYAQNYYSLSPYDNPQGPNSGFVMPDGKAYRGMRGGNWYNGLVTNGINDGHSRVANRNPSYYRGPQDPNHPWYHVGFRVARNYGEQQTGISISDGYLPTDMQLYQNYPNPFNHTTTLSFALPRAESVSLKVYNSIGQWVATLEKQRLDAGLHKYQWDAGNLPSGIYYCRLIFDDHVSMKKMLLLR